MTEVIHVNGAYPVPEHGTMLMPLPVVFLRDMRAVDVLLHIQPKKVQISKQTGPQIHGHGSGGEAFEDL